MFWGEASARVMRGEIATVCVGVDEAGADHAIEEAANTGAFAVEGEDGCACGGKFVEGGLAVDQSPPKMTLYTPFRDFFSPVYFYKH